MEFKDYYQILGVTRDATLDEIKAGYRKLARKYHPDVSKAADAEERFKEVGEAYEVLKDAEKRAAYDRLGSRWKQGQDFRPPPDWDAGFEFSGGFPGGGGAGSFSDFFESLFGGGLGPSAARPGGRTGFRARGEDHHAKIAIDLEDAYTGATRAITLQAPRVDKKGHVQVRERTLNVRIPKGVKQGQRIRLAGQGAPGAGGGGAGDLFLEVEFKPHAFYRVEGRDVTLTLPLAPWEAALGARVKVPTPTGPVDLKVPPDSRGGSKLRLKERGIPGRPPGDLFVVTEVRLPPADTDKAREFYRAMERDLAFDPRAEMGG